MIFGCGWMVVGGCWSVHRGISRVGFPQDRYDGRMQAAGIQAVSARRIFQAPGEQVNGLEAVPEGLWLCDQRNNRCYLIDYDGRELTSFAGPARNASGISFGAGSVWVASNTRPSLIFRHDPASGQCLAYLVLSGEGGVHGLQWRPYGPSDTLPGVAAIDPELHPTAPAGRLNAGPGVSGTLWVSRPGAHRIEHIDAETGELLGQIAFAPPRSHGMFWDERDNTLSVAETNGGHILKFEPASGELLDEWRIDGCEVHGLSRGADGRIWIGDASTNSILTV
jgi:streptogramin lyase